MKAILRNIALGATVALLALGAACGGDDGDDTNGGDDGTAGAPTATVLAPTPFATPVIEGNTIRSNAKGYSATFPADWRPRANQIQTVDASTDAFFEPTGQIANISVTCLTDLTQTHEEWVRDQKALLERIGLNSDLRESARTVGGTEASVFDYTFTSEQTGGTGPLDKQDVLLSSDNCHWTITTLARQGERPTYQAAFDAFLDSFQLFAPTE